MSRITITIVSPDTLDTKDFVFEVDDALNMGFKHEFAMWTIEPKTGRWITDGWDARCSECDWWVDDDMTSNYCPNCGAKMEEE